MSRRRRLARLARRAGDAFGGPQDIEWAFDERDHRWLVQSRAVTATGDVAVEGPGPVDLLAAPGQLDDSEVCMAQGRVRGELDPAIEGLLGSPAASVPALARSADPVTYVDAGRKLPPFFIAHGDQDCVVPYQGSADLDAALRTAGASSTFVLVAGSGHYTAFDAASQVPDLLAFLGRTIGDEPSA